MYVKLCSIAHRIAAPDLRVLVVAVVLDQALLRVAHRVVHLVLQPVPEIEEEKEVVAKVPMPREDMKIKKRRGIRREKGNGIGTRTETARRKERREIMLSLIKLNKKDDPGIIFML